MKNSSAIFLLVLMTVVGAFADSSTFSESEGQNALASIIQQQAQNKITLVSFKKTDGQKNDFAGIASYRMDFEAIIQFAVNGGWQDGSFNATTDQSYKDTIWASFYKAVTPGSRATISGTLQGEESEKGWTIKIVNNELVSGPTAGTRLSTSIPPINQQNPQVAAELQNEMFRSIGASFSRFVTNRSRGEIRTRHFFPTLKEVLTGPKYVLNYRSEIEFLSDGVWLSGSPKPNIVNFRFTNDAASISDHGSQSVHHGEHAQVSGELTADKGEHGWRFHLDEGRIDWIGKPSGGDIRQDAESRCKACIANLRLIDAAKQQWALEEQMRPTETPEWTNILRYMGRGTSAQPLACPSDGTYTLNAVNAQPQCSIPGHVLP